MMSEKRFKSVIDEDTMSIMPYLVSDKEEECFYNLQGCVDLLNEQQDIIGEQKIAIDELITDYKNLEKENEKLKQEIKQYWKYRDKWKQEAKELKKENGQLRRLFEEMKQPKTINLTEEDEKELRKLLGLINNEWQTI